MTTTSPPLENADASALNALGRALVVLRTRANLNQAQAGERFGTSGQGWAKYENGRAPAIFKPSVQTRLAAAVNATRDDLLAEAQRDEPAETAQ